MRIDSTNEFFSISASVLKKLSKGGEGVPLQGLSLTSEEFSAALRPKTDGFAEKLKPTKTFMQDLEGAMLDPATMKPFETPAFQDVDWAERYNRYLRGDCEVVSRFEAGVSYMFESRGFLRVANTEEVSDAFTSSFDIYARELKEGRASGTMSEEEYILRQEGLNKAYDDLLYRYAFTSADKAGDWLSSFETRLGDIKSRYANGDFGDGEDAFEARLEAWNKAFDQRWEWDKFIVSSWVSSLTIGYYERNCDAAGDAGAANMWLTNQFFSDVGRMFGNVRDHLLAGGSAATATDAIREKGCQYGTANDWRYLNSAEFKEILWAFHEQTLSLGDISKTQSEDKKQWESLYSDLKERVERNTSLSNTLKTMFSQRVEFGLSFIPKHHKNNFIPD